MKVTSLVMSRFNLETLLTCCGLIEILFHLPLMWEESLKDPTQY